MQTKIQTPPLQNSVPPQISGMNCPVCKGFIPISIYQLLHDTNIICPHCSLSLSINHTLSQPAMDALKKVEEANNRVRKTENFKL
ncbi:MAG: hypothetical protein RRX93_01195 [Bacteroidales bacterium]